MSTVSLGEMSTADPLYQVLAFGAYPEVKHPVFHVERLSRRHLVYRYVERGTRKAVVGKFFCTDDPDRDKVVRIKSEYRNLIRLRYLGFNTRPYSVVRPLCSDWRIGLAVAEDFVQGKTLDHYLRAAAWGGDGAALRRTLANLASFLYMLHSKTGGGAAARVEDVAGHYGRIVLKLCRQCLLTTEWAAVYLMLRDIWLQRPCMDAEAVTVHGDATPTNFLFPTERDVVAIDLERMRHADRIFDVGMVCGEIKHAFLWRTGNKYASEPFIRHFLQQYARHFVSPRTAFEAITRRVPFYMALTELRIARNDWLDWQYRQRLVWEAHECLTWGLRL